MNYQLHSDQQMKTDRWLDEKITGALRGATPFNNEKLPEVRAQIERVHAVISATENTLSALEMRLQPVLSSQPSQALERERPLGTAEGSTEYSQMLAGAGERLEQLQMCMSDMLRRLEV